jgi:hypothetical protein
MSYAKADMWCQRVQITNIAYYNNTKISSYYDSSIGFLSHNLLVMETAVTHQQPLIFGQWHYITCYFVSTSKPGVKDENLDKAVI